jgi:hypothetical protein
MGTIATALAVAIFNKERKLNKYQVDELIREAFPAVPYHENKFLTPNLGLKPRPCRTV